MPDDLIKTAFGAYRQLPPEEGDWQPRQKRQNLISGKRYLKMLGGEPKTAPPKRPQVGKPNVMSARKHRIIGHAGYSPKLRHAIKREAEAQERKPRNRGQTYASLTDALKAFKPR